MPSRSLFVKPRAVSWTTADGWTVKGLYHRPQRGRGVAILVHGPGGNKEEWDAYAPRLWVLGLGTLAIDLRARGGTAEEWRLAERDLTAAVDFLKKYERAPSGIIGESIGANLASRAAANRKLGWVVLLSPSRSYKAVALGDPRGRPELAAASREDPEAYETAQSLAKAGAFFLEAPAGRGLRMLKDGEFRDRLFRWIDANNMRADKERSR